MKKFNVIYVILSQVLIIFLLYNWYSDVKEKSSDKLVYSENGVELYYNEKGSEYTVYEDGSELFAPEPGAEEKITGVEIYDHIDLLTCSDEAWENNPEYYRVYLREEKKWLVAQEGGSTFKRFKLYKDKIVLERAGEGLTVYTFDTKIVEEVFPY